jgi:hypothetical protein
MEHLARKFAYLVALAENRNSKFADVRKKANNLFIGSRVDFDHEFYQHMLDKISPDAVLNASASGNHLSLFENNFADWILSHKTSSIIGLDQYQPDYSEGTTQAFDSFYYRHRTKRFRCFVGEYFYHVKTWQATNTNWCWTDGSDLVPGDALVLSLPFCDTVSTLPNLDLLLESCSDKNIPVLLDLCYYTISSGVNVNVTHSCIDTVAFSLSKAWPVSTARIGMRYTRPDVFDGQKLHSQISYNNNVGAYLGNLIIKNYSPDWIHNSKKVKYNTICQVLDLKPTLSVHFAIGDHQWHRHSRKILLESYKLNFDSALFVNRIYLNKFYQYWDLFKAVVYHETNTII